MKYFTKSLVLAASLSLLLSGCIGTVIGAATDATIAVAKVPFKVGGAVVDVVKGDDEDEKKKK
jgi:hypothetical protein